MKLLVQTQGQFQLLVEGTNELVRASGVSVVTAGSGFLNQFIAADKVEVLGKVGDRATQKDWDDALKQSDGDVELAIPAFIAEFPVEEQAGVGVVPLPVTQTGPAPSNRPGSDAPTGLPPDVKPAAPGEDNGPGGPKDTNVPSAGHKHAPSKK